MKPDQDLRRLAAHCGIATEYFDIRGHSHPATDETCRAVLAAMHLPIAESDPATLLDSLEDEAWQRPLPPVLVIRSGQRPAVLLNLPARQSALLLHWTLILENGEIRRGEFVPDQLPRLGERHVESSQILRFRLDLPPLESNGYHRLELALHEPDSHPAMALIVAPASCYQPDAIKDDGRVWGLALQLYGVRSHRNWGIGDFTDLANLIDFAADAGAGIVGLNPLHALFPDQPGRVSPYSPSSRSFINTLYIDVEAATEFGECTAAQSLVGSPDFQARLRSLCAENLVNYPAVASAKREVLDLLYRHFCTRHLASDSEHARAFQGFRQAGGEVLEAQARFEALQAHFSSADAGIWGWPAWPEAYRDPAAPAVAEFASSHAGAIGFYIWLQWLADSQLDQAGRLSAQRGLGVGLYEDLAVGVTPGGGEAWRWQQVFATAAYAGAPPDDFSLKGQDWGLPPFVPHRLREAAYAPLIEVLRANMRHAGALRIDHAMGLMRLFWVPAGLSPTQGTYVGYPFEEMLGIVALESQRNRCLVVGEDLGTVPEGFRPRLAEAGILSYHPFLFERSDDGTFKPPDDYPRQALVAASTHDLPTLAGLWKGCDLDTRAALQMFPDKMVWEAQVVARAQDRGQLLMALERAQLLPASVSIHPVAVPTFTAPLSEAVHTYLARTPARIFVVQPEDIFGIEEQANLPGSRDDQHPNWRRRLMLDIEDWRTDQRFARLGTVLRRERGSAVAPQPEPPPPPRRATIPRATYRLQFNRDFTFAQATELVPYLARLGISHCYASPYLKARPGSVHGYDIVDHAALNPEIGTPDDYERFVGTLHAHGMGQVLDIVPNHMGVMGADNAWWMDVLENGPSSAYGSFFDIDWDPLNPELKGKLLLPLLGDHYGKVLEHGELRLEFDAGRGEFTIYYYQHRLPVDPATYPHIVGHRAEHLAAILGEKDERLVELQSLLTAFARLPARNDSEVARRAERQRDKEVHKRHLATLCAVCTDIARHIDDNVASFNGKPGNPASFDAMHELLQAQSYRLAFWRVASDEINYRRFFDINELAALRMEEPAVFEATHRFVLDLVAQGKVDGLRIDHPDGLYDPAQYFSRLQEQMGHRPGTGEPLPLYLVIEKILADHERLPDDWAIHGATGYRFANLVNGLFVDATAERRMTRIYQCFISDLANFNTIVERSKKLIMDSALSSEISILSHRLARLAAASRDTCDFTLNGLRDALIEVIACFPVYRTYISAAGPSTDDRRHIDWAIGIARKRSTATDGTIFDFVQGVLTTDIAQGRCDRFHADILSFAMKFQQVSTPIMAKGVEDTSFYRYHRLVSSNEVGGDPRRFGVSVAAYHATTQSRAKFWPHNLLATSTHDSKRSEDVRARLDVLTEMPAAWKLMTRRWSRLNRTKKRHSDGLVAPTANDEYLLYQTLVGTWPLGDPASIDLDAYRQRIETYMIKAVREAKENSSWMSINGEYETALSDFIGALLGQRNGNLFLADFVPAVQHIARHGLFNSLATTLLKLTSPGVPDIYRGCELWQFHLVDPDNRQPVDFAARQQMLDHLMQDFLAPPEQWPELLQQLMANLDDGRIKLYLIWRTLALRTDLATVFRDGDYQPLAVSGQFADHICAFMRRHGNRTILVAVPRLSFKLVNESETPPLGETVWRDTAIELPKNFGRQSWMNVLSGQGHEENKMLQVGKLFAEVPVALLSGTSDGAH